MSTRAQFEAAFGPEAARDHACAVCGSRDWTAYWMGAREIVICRGCAGTTVPALIADAVWYPRLILPEAERALEEVQKEYWRAIAIQALRARDREAV